MVFKVSLTNKFFSQFLALGPFAPVGFNREYDSALSESSHTLPMRLLMGTVMLSFALYGIWLTARPILRRRPKRSLKEISTKLKWGLASICFLCVSLMSLAICVFLNIGG